MIFGGDTIIPMGAGKRFSRGRREYNGYFIISVVFLAAAFTIGGSNYAFGLFIEPLEDTYNWNRTAIQASLSFMAVGSLAAPFLGRLIDLYGAKVIMVTSLLIMALSFALRPLITELWHWYVLSFFQFVCFLGVTVLPSGRLAAIWFPKSKGRYLGIMAAGNNFGGATMPPLTWFLISMVSWQAAFLAYSSIAVLIALMVILVVHEDPLFDPDKETSDASVVGTSDISLIGSSVKEALYTTRFYTMTLAMVMGSFTYGGVLPWISAHLINEGMSAESVPHAVTLMAIFGIMGKLVFGYIAERITARRGMMISLGGQTVFILLLTAYASTFFVWIGVPLYGLFMGAWGALVPLIILENFGAKRFGSISGLVNLAMSIAFAAGPLIAGTIFDATLSYSPTFIVMAILFIIGIISIFNTPQPESQPQSAV